MDRKANYTVWIESLFPLKPITQRNLTSMLLMGFMGLKRKVIGIILTLFSQC